MITSAYGRLTIVLMNYRIFYGYISLWKIDHSFYGYMSLRKIDHSFYGYMSLRKIDYSLYGYMSLWKIDHSINELQNVHYNLGTKF